MDKEGKKIKKLYDNYLALKKAIEGTAFLTEDGILVELELISPDSEKTGTKKEGYVYGG